MRVELAAYAEDGADMAARERELTAQLRLLEFPAEEPPLWEANTWYTTYPVYWQNYILASVIAAQVHEAITEQFDFINRRFQTAEDATGSPQGCDIAK